MSGPLEIRSGGVIAVDTADLRHAATRLEALAADGEGVRGTLGGVVGRAAAVGVWIAPFPLIDEAIDSAAATAVDLRRLAAVYELVELTAERVAAIAAGDHDRVDALTHELIARQNAATPEQAAEAWQLRHRWERSSHDELERQALWATLPFGLGIGAAMPLMLGLVRGVGLGTVPAHARLRGEPHAVAVRPLRVTTAATAPASVTDLTRRMPGQGDGRVRVERYTMPDGSRQFAAYIAGTVSMTDPAEPFNMASNLDLYGGARSPSYDVAVAALHAAGAGTGDVVHLTGHSQGGMIASRLALEGEFDVATLVTFGSPVQADVGAGTLEVAVRHSDDPVAALAAGGYGHGTGAPGSFVAERVADPMPSIGDAGFGVHQLDEYAQTAAMLDDSTDPRMAAVRERFAELGSAVAVTARVYGVVGATASLSGGGG